MKLFWALFIEAIIWYIVCLTASISLYRVEFNPLDWDVLPLKTFIYGILFFWLVTIIPENSIFAKLIAFSLGLICICLIGYIFYKNTFDMLRIFE